jgi:DNA-binding transcriptional ArsR family regulator
LRLVQHTELPAGQIAAHFDRVGSHGRCRLLGAVSQHLTVLKRAGLLAERREGTRRLYSLQFESLQPLRNLIEGFWPDALARLKQTVEQNHPRHREKRTDVIRTSVRIAAVPEVVFRYFTTPS